MRRKFFSERHGFKKVEDNFQIKSMNINKELPFKVSNDKTIKAIKELENGDVKKSNT